MEASILMDLKAQKRQIKEEIKSQENLSSEAVQQKLAEAGFESIISQIREAAESGKNYDDNDMLCFSHCSPHCKSHNNE